MYLVCCCDCCQNYWLGTSKKAADYCTSLFQGQRRLLQERVNDLLLLQVSWKDNPFPVEGIKNLKGLYASHVQGLYFR